ncbi:MAG TPA: peptidoglycan-binding protein [Oculatellaceae cyanobacterium]
MKAYNADVHSGNIPVVEKSNVFSQGSSQKLFSKTLIYLLALAMGISFLGTAGAALAELQAGDRGKEVTTLQQRLKRLGYFNGQVNGNFASATKAAVIRFQKAKGLTADGVVGDATAAALYNNRARKTATASNFQRRTTTQSKKSVTSTSKDNFLQPGDRGSEVRKLQSQLKQAGFYKDAIDGVFSTSTEAAIKRFQQAKKITVDGLAGTRTIALLQSATRQSVRKPSTSATKLPSVQQNQSKAKVERLQQQLKQLSYYKGQINGSFNAETKDAVIRFQRNQGLVADGIPGVNTLSVLENITRRESIKALQVRLQQNGFYTGPIDGILSAPTQAAIAKAQNAYGISANDVMNQRF